MIRSSYFPVVKSFLSQEGLVETIAAAYGLSDVHCQLITASMRDVYRVSSGRQDSIFFITEIECEALPAFEAVRYIFSIGIPALNVDHWGSAYLHVVLDQSLGQLREGMKSLLSAG